MLIITAITAQSTVALLRSVSQLEGKRMTVVCRRTYLLSVMAVLLLPLPARAIPAITCHCFTDRSYDPARPALADPYFLATTQNSFFAAVFNCDKKALVLKKQQGASSDDLWIAYRSASAAGATPEALLQARLKHDSWQAAIAPLRLSAQVLGRRFAAALAARASTARLAEAVVDDLLLNYRLLGEGELQSLRQARATNQELIIATVIAVKTGQPARQVYLEVKNGAGSWGAQLQRARLEPKELQREIAVILQQPR